MVRSIKGEVLSKRKNNLTIESLTEGDVRARYVESLPYWGATSKRGSIMVESLGFWGSSR